MKRKQLLDLVREVLRELSSTGGGQYATPYAFYRGKKDNKATTYMKKFGYKKVSRPKRPSSTKLIDYLN